VILGPGLKVAVGAAAQLKSNLPPAVLSALLRHDDPSIRAAACCCTRAIPEIVSGEQRACDAGNENNVQLQTQCK